MKCLVLIITLSLTIAATFSRELYKPDYKQRKTVPEQYPAWTQIEQDKSEDPFPAEPSGFGLPNYSPFKVGTFFSGTDYHNKDLHFETGHETTKDEDRKPTFLDLLHKHLRTPDRHFSFPSFGHSFFGVPQLPGKTKEDDTQTASNEDYGGTLTGFGGFDKKFFGPSFRVHLLNPTLIHNLPPNYKNSTSQVHNIDGSKVVVNQTINKKSDDNFHHFHHTKVIHISPQENEYDIQTGSDDGPKIPGKRIHFPIDTDQPVPDNEVELPDHVPVDSSDSKDKSYALKTQVRRSVDDSRTPSSGNNKIVFPPKDLNRFPHSKVNGPWSKDSSKSGDEKISRTYVYKNLGGKSYLYKISHNDDKVDITTKSSKYLETNTINGNDDVGTIGPIRPPDLSRDTRVNPDGSGTQQGMVIADPDAEVFDLSLVIEEMESRANEE